MLHNFFYFCACRTKHLFIKYAFSFILSQKLLLQNSTKDTLLLVHLIIIFKSFPQYYGKVDNTINKQNFPTTLSHHFPFIQQS